MEILMTILLKMHLILVLSVPIVDGDIGGKEDEKGGGD